MGRTYNFLRLLRLRGWLQFVYQQAVVAGVCSFWVGLRDALVVFNIRRSYQAMAQLGESVSVVSRTQYPGLADMRMRTVFLTWTQFPPSRTESRLRSSPRLWPAAELQPGLADRQSARL